MLKIFGLSRYLLPAFLCLFSCSWLQAQKPIVRIGFVIDGPWETNATIQATFEEEIGQLLENEYTILFPPEKRLQADWTTESIKASIDRLLLDPEVDYLITLGVISSNDVARRGPLSKPVIAPFVLNPGLQGIPREPRKDGSDVYSVSGVENLNYLTVGTVGRSLLREVSVFGDIVDFSKLTFFTMEVFTEAIPQLAANVVNELEPLGLELTLVHVGDSLEEALEQIPADTEAVYLAPLLQLQPGDLDRLARELIRRRLPSFSLWGRSEVERGLMASLANDLNVDRLARRVAIHLQDLLLGADAGDLAVDFDRDEQLTINMATARAIGVYPSFTLLTEAELLDEVRTQATRNLSLSAVILEAGKVNLDVAVADRTVSAGLQLVREARSALLPQLFVSGAGSFIDADRAAASFGSVGQRQISGSASASQLIYSEQVWANRDIEESLQSARLQERAEVLLDVVLEAAQSYLNVLRAKTVERIQRDNLGLTQVNLGLARARVELGAAARDEVFRWESQIATNRKDVIDANAQRNQAEIAVNRILDRPSEEIFTTLETSLDDPELITSFEQLRPYVDNPQSFRIFRDFMVAEAFENSPELRQLDSAIRAQQRARLASRRTFYLPTIAAIGEVTAFKNGGTSLDFSPALPLPFSIPNSLNWTAGISATLPLFQGGALRARRDRSGIELRQLTIQRDAVRKRIEQGVRSVLHAAGASFAGIDLSQAAAAAARRNLELISDSYSEGVVDILRLLDAQNQALVAELLGANAIFDYLLDLMVVQRGVGKFDYYRSLQDRQAFLDRLARYFQNQGFVIRRP